MGLAKGTFVGPYEIESAIGAGGMGEVYRARDPRLGRDVAIKVVSSPFAFEDPSLIERFQREARTVSLLNHPNVVAIYDVGVHGRLPYLVTELLEGETLRQRIGLLSYPKAVEYAQQISRGLAAAHEKGITHRDLKPENLFITRGDGIIKILDFGLAKISASQRGSGSEIVTVDRQPQEETKIGVVLGTAGYMSPEQVRGNRADHRSDVFSFGAVLYEMFSGNVAFAAPTPPERMAKILNFEPAPIPTIPPTLERIIFRCLEKNPDERFQSTRDLSFALQTISAGTSTTGTAIARPENETLARPGRGRIKTAVAVAAAMLATGLAGYFIARPRPAPLPSYTRVTYRDGNLFSARFTPDGRSFIYGASWSGEPVRVYTSHLEFPEPQPLGPAGEASNLLSVSSKGELAMVTHAVRVPNFYQWIGMMSSQPLGGGSPREIAEGIVEADWAPDGSGLAIVHEVGGKHRLEYPVGTVLYETAGWISTPRFSPSGQSIAFLDHPVGGDDMGVVAVVDLAGTKKNISPTWQGLEGLAWAPSGTEVWFSANVAGADFSVYAATMSGKTREVLRGPETMLVMDIAPDGRLLIARHSQSNRLMIRTGDTERDMSWLGSTWPPILSPDEKFVVFTEDAEAAGPLYSVCLRRLDGSPIVKLGSGSADSLSPDGKWVLARVQSSPPKLMLLPTGAGQPKTLERGQIERYGQSDFLPDGKRVLISGNEPGHPRANYIQNVDGGPPQPISWKDYRANSRSVSPDGRWVICRNPAKEYARCPLNGGEPEPLPAIEPNETPMGWTADSRFVYVAVLTRLPVRVFKVDASVPGDKSRRALWKEITPANSVGFSSSGPLSISRDEKTIAYSFARHVSQLYLVEGAK